MLGSVSGRSCYHNVGHQHSKVQYIYRTSSTPLNHVAPSRPRYCTQIANVSSVEAPAASVGDRDGSQAHNRSHETEVVVIGSGLGGLCCAAMLATYGVKVIVCESHGIPGGAAHAWVDKAGYHFESGPSLYSGMSGSGRGANPIAHVLQAIDEPLDLIEYNRWNVFLPEGQFLTEVGNDQFEEVLQQASPSGISDWRRQKAQEIMRPSAKAAILLPPAALSAESVLGLTTSSLVYRIDANHLPVEKLQEVMGSLAKKLQEVMRPLAKAATLLPPAAFRADPLVALTAFARYIPYLVQGGGDIGKLIGPFSKVIDGAGITDKFVRNWLDLLSFLLSGLPADGTIAAEVAFMFNEWYRPNCCLEYPRGGSQSIVQALVRGIKKHGGKVMLNAHVEEVLIEGGRAKGVKLRGGGIVRASKSVVSNASLWDTQRLLPDHVITGKMRKEAQDMPMNRSFMHLHLGFDASGLDNLELHHIVVNSWEGGVDTEQNVVLISIASVMDPSLAPAGKHTLHAYLPATEPFHLWEDLERGSPEYEKLKEERSQVLWRAVEKVVPDIRQRTEVEMVGTPLTHRHFLRRHKGTYGPAIRAGEGTFPGPKTPIPGLLVCGDSTFPGIGVPAVAASGAIAANSLVPVWDHWKMLDRIGV